jgi:hypothetical protein
MKSWIIITTLGLKRRGREGGVGVLHLQHGCCQKEIKALNICIQLFGLFHICSDNDKYQQQPSILSRCVATHCDDAKF